MASVSCCCWFRARSDHQLAHLVMCARLDIPNMVRRSSVCSCRSSADLACKRIPQHTCHHQHEGLIATVSFTAAGPRHAQPFHMASTNNCHTRHIGRMSDDVIITKTVHTSNSPACAPCMHCSASLPCRLPPAAGHGAPENAPALSQPAPCDEMQQQMPVRGMLLELLELLWLCY
jgi:hypothetical protein